MGTRSLIARENQDGTVDAIYCHWDGYPTWNGRILLNHYQDRAKVDQLIELGNISILGEEIGEKHPFTDADSPPGICTAYGRDRGEDDTKATRYPSKRSLTGKRLLTNWGAEYCYLFTKHGTWVFFKRYYDAPSHSFKPLTLESVAEPKVAV